MLNKATVLCYILRKRAQLNLCVVHIEMNGASIIYEVCFFLLAQSMLTYLLFFTCISIVLLLFSKHSYSISDNLSLGFCFI